MNGAKLLAWARQLAETDDVVMRILDNKLVAYVAGDDNLHGGVKGQPWKITQPWEGKPSTSDVISTPIVQPEPKVAETVVSPEPEVKTNESTDIAGIVIEVVVNHTGYPADFVELDQDLEGELGIDTVKQAEIMADIRDRFTLPLDEEFVLSDYPTLNHMIGYIQQMTSGGGTGDSAKGCIKIGTNTCT